MCMWSLFCPSINHRELITVEKTVLSEHITIHKQSCLIALSFHVEWEQRRIPTVHVRSTVILAYCPSASHSCTTSGNTGRTCRSGVDFWDQQQKDVSIRKPECLELFNLIVSNHPLTRCFSESLKLLCGPVGNRRPQFENY